MKSSRLQKLFAELQVVLADEIYKRYDKVANKVANIQKTNRDTILDSVARIILEFEVIDGVLSLSTATRTSLKRELNKLIKDVLKGEYEDESAVITDTLFNVAKDKYYSNCYLYGLGINYTLKPVTENVLKKIINKKIDGKTYSQRIWANKNKVAKQLRVEVDQFLNGKTTINEINSRIRKRFDVNWSNSNRLVRDSIGRVQWDANKVWRNEHNISKVMWDATLDRKTCDDCQTYDGKVYDSNDTPNQHVMCRCELIPLVEGWKPTERIDNITKQRINYKTYQEWYKEQDFET